MLHMLASLNADGDFAAARLWTTYPGHDGAPNAAMREFLDVAAKLARNRYREDLLVRFATAERSNAIFHRAGIAPAIDNQLTTVRVGDAHRGKLDGQRILLLDNFLTWGSTTESGRNLLLAAGASTVKVACVGKYGDRMYAVGAPSSSWDPFKTSAPAGSSFRYEERLGARDLGALHEFAALYAAMSKEQW